MGVEIKVIDGAEVRVETGKGLITTADLDEGQSRNRKIEIKATHTNLTKPVGAWLDSTNNALFLAVQEAVAQGVEVEYVIHVVRKRDVDKALTFAELRSDQKARDLHSIRPANAPRVAVTSPSSEPSVPAARSTSEAPSIPAQGPSPAKAVRRGVRIEEAKPWERHNTDGSVNLGSYEATAVIGMASLAYRLLLEKNRVEATAKGGDVAAPNAAQVKNLGTILLQAADAAQAAVRSDGCSDRMDSSHTRARGAVREALDAYPVPWGAGEAERLAWRDTLAFTAALLLKVGVELLDAPPGSLDQVKAGAANQTPPDGAGSHGLPETGPGSDSARALTQDVAAAIREARERASEPV